MYKTHPTMPAANVGLRRMLALMLVLITVLGMFPVPVVAADSGGPPSTIRLKSIEHSKRYTSTIDGINNAPIHFFNCDVGGSIITAFCMDHEFLLSSFGFEPRDYFFAKKNCRCWAVLPATRCRLAPPPLLQQRANT